MTMEIDRPWNNGNNRTSRKKSMKGGVPIVKKTMVFEKK